MTTRARHILVVCLLAGQLLQSALGQSEPDTDVRYVRGLQDLRLFALAESFCGRRLADSRLTPRQRAELTVERIRSLAGQALDQQPGRRDRFWQAAHNIAAEFARQHAGNARLRLVQTQDALTYVAHGELARQEAEVGNAQQTLNVAKQQLRAAARLLLQIEKDLTSDIPQAERNQQPDRLAASELLSLQANVQFQLARVYRNQALCYRAGSTDRVNSLTRAVAQLAKPLKVFQEDPLTSQVLLELAVCHRLLGDLNQAQQSIQALERTQPGDQAKLRIRAERIRLELAANRLEAARRLVAAGREIDGQVSAQLDYAHLETVLALWQAADQTKNADQAGIWQQRAVAMVRLIEQLHGAYWGRRASGLLVAMAGRGRGAGNLDLLERTADELYLKQQYAEAINAYDRAAEFALSLANREAAFLLRRKAAEVEKKQNRLAEYVDRLRAAAREMRQLPQASAAHMVACRESLQLPAVAGGDRKLVGQLLAEHIQLWPQSKTANEARVRLGIEFQNQQRLAEAIASYQQVTVDYPNFAAVVQTVSQCWSQRLAQVRTGDAEAEELAGQAIAYFDSIVWSSDGGLPERWSDAARQAAVAAARLRVQFASSGLARAQAALTAALSGQPAASKPWLDEAQLLLVLLLAAQGKVPEAAAQVEALGQAAPRQVLEMLSQLSQIGRAARPRTRQQLAQTQLAVVAKLQPSAERLGPAEQRTFHTLHAQSLADAGQWRRATALFQQLVEKHPRDVTLQTGYAQTLLDQSDPNQLQTALERWRLIESRTKKCSPLWYRAKYSVALAYFKLGNKPRARQLIEYLKNTTGYQKSSWAVAFDNLLAKCR